MPLSITQRIEDEIGVLEISGQLTLGPSLVELRNTARQFVEANKLKGLVLQVGSVTQTDSSGLGELTVVYTLASKKGCPLRLVDVRPELRKILQLTRLDGLLPSAVDMATAKNEFRRTTARTASSQG
jgi:anti-anti-sigma factor